MSESQSFSERAFKSKGLFWIVLIGGLVADLASKAWADAYVRPTDPKVTPIIDGFIGWKWATNEGAAFSILSGRPLLLALIAAAVLGALFLYMYRVESNRKWFLTALGLVASGAIGNLYDRLLLGHVRDFMFFIFDLPFHGTKIVNFEIPVKYPVFNVADIAIIAGVLVLVVISFKSEKKDKEPGEKSIEQEPKAEKQAEPEPQEAAHGA